MSEAAISLNWRIILKHEFSAAEGTVMLHLRCGGWNHEAYQRLFIAMRECCKAHDGDTHLERWIVDGFWWLEYYTRVHIRDSDSDYKQNMMVNFSHLAHWLFTGHSRTDDQFEPIELD